MTKRDSQWWDYVREWSRYSGDIASQAINEKCRTFSDRDHFAAAALTGLLAGPAAGPAQTFDDFASEAYQLADAMLRERDETNHDAAPAARASVGRPRTDKADLPTRCGTGDTPVTQPPPVFVSGSGSVTPVSYAKTNAERVDYATNRGTTPPRNGALSDGPAPDSRVWETPCTPQPHATPTKGSVHGEGDFRDSQNAIEPVAWAVEDKDGVFDVDLSFSLMEGRCVSFSKHGPARVFPLYRHPQPTLTDEEREAVRVARDAYADDDGNAECEEIAAVLTSVLERLGGGR